MPTERTDFARLLSLCADRDVLSLALGLPAAELLPTNVCSEAAVSLLSAGSSALQMAPISGLFRRQIADLMVRRGVRCRPEQVFPTTGAQQALYLVARAFVGRGTEVLLDEVTYSGMLNVLGLVGARPWFAAVVPSRGSDVDAIEAALATGRRPAFLYLMPDGHNPLGTSMTSSERTRVVELAARQNVPIVEDSPYGFLQLDAQSPPALCALDPDNVIHVGSFSKIFGPALRTGWMVVPEPLVDAFSRLKDAIDTDSSPFAARLVSRVLEDETFIDRHLRTLRQAFRERRDRLLLALTRATPQCGWTSPQCGLFVWLRLPPGVDPRHLLELAIEQEGLAFVPGTTFGDGPAARRGVRLSYGSGSFTELDEAAARLGRALDRCGHQERGAS